MARLSSLMFFTLSFSFIPVWFHILLGFCLLGLFFLFFVGVFCFMSLTMPILLGLVLKMLRDHVCVLVVY